MTRGPVNAETTTSPDLGQKRWCPDHRKRATIEDVFEDSQWDSRGEVALIVTVLDCGHALHRQGNVVCGHRTGVSARPVVEVSDPWA